MLRAPTSLGSGEGTLTGAQHGPASRELFDLARPEIRWTKLSEGMGVEAVRVEPLEAFTDAFTTPSKTERPFTSTCTSVVVGPTKSIPTNEADRTRVDINFRIAFSLVRDA